MQRKSYDFVEVAQRFRESHFEDIALGSMRSYIPALNRAVDYFGNKSIDKIKPKDIKQFLQRCGETYAYKTVRNQKCVLSQIFDFAIIDMDLMICNPCSGQRISNKLPRSTRSLLTTQQVIEIKSTSPSEFLLAFLILYTGTRCGEALALQYKDIDFESRKIEISKSVHFIGNRPIIGALKSSSSARRVPLLVPLIEMLSRCSYKPNDYIIGKSEPITKSKLQRQWEKYCRTHNMAIPVVRKATSNNRHTTVWKPMIDRHQIRHEYATILFEAKIETKDIQRMLGHSDYHTTMNIYVHWRENRIAEITERVDSFLKSE